MVVDMDLGTRGEEGGGEMCEVEEMGEGDSAGLCAGGQGEHPGDDEAGCWVC